MLTETEEHSNPGVRHLEIERHAANNCGFNLTRSKWDPYPWISSVDGGSAAEIAGMRPGDCLLEVNGEDVLGQRVGEIAEMVRARPDHVSLLLWNAGVDPQCGPESLCCGPMPSNMQLLSTCMSSILSALECPICLDTIAPPACQCINGHLVCVRCHTKSERCPVCRVRISRGRSLFADQVYNSITDTFIQTKETDQKSRSAKINELFRLQNNKKTKKTPEIKVTQSHTNKFLEKHVEKSSSAENLTNHFLTPFLSDEYNMRTKSLSTSEIFRSASPGVPGRTGFRGTSKNDLNSKMNTSRRSLESLNDGNIPENKQNNSIIHSNDLLYYCPFNIDCENRIKGNMMIQHFQNMHDGPLIQYFKSKISFNLSSEYNDTYYISNNLEKYFFLRIDTQNEVHSSVDTFHDILLWIWLLGDQNAANDYQYKIYVYYSDSPDKKLLCLDNTVYSLYHMSFHDMKEMKKGIFISKEILRALSVNYKGDIMLDVEIICCD